MPASASRAGAAGAVEAVEATSGPLVPCPTCKGPSRFAPSNAWRPFCSERCKTIDLGAWATEQFRVPAGPVEADGDSGHLGGPEGSGPREPHAH